MRILLLPDKKRWAYETIAKALKKYNMKNNVKLDIVHIKGNSNKIKKIYKKYDRFLVMGWQNYMLVKFLPKNLTMVGLHSHHSWDGKKTTPEKNVDPPAKLIGKLSKFMRVNAVSNKLYSLFKKNGLEKIHYTPNGVDTQIFKDFETRSNNDFFVGYSGSKAHDWRKGTSKFIIPSAKRANVKVKLAMLSSKNYVSVEEMPKFYNGLHCYVCASSSEGFSLSVLEAVACGGVLITTNVGGMKELVRDGVNGFVVKRNVEEISEKIMFLKNNKELCGQMRTNMIADINHNWGWDKRSVDWINFLIK